MRYMGLIIALTSLLVRAEDIVSQLEEEPIVSKRLINHDPWEVVDWYTGLFIGFYEPLIARAYDNDCYSALFGFGVNIIIHSSYFDTGKLLNTVKQWMGLLLPVILSFVDTYNVLSVCVK